LSFFFFYSSAPSEYGNLLWLKNVSKYFVAGAVVVGTTWQAVDL